MASKIHKWGFVLAVSAGCAGLFCSAMPALAMPQFLERARKTYTLGKEAGKCQLCHNLDEKDQEPTDENLNIYAKDLRKGTLMKKLHGLGEEEKLSDEQSRILDDAFKAIDDKDSDGDGATNKEELILQSNPGNAKIFPAKEALEKYRKDNPKK
jgi:hypothetical protein